MIWQLARVILVCLAAWGATGCDTNRGNSGHAVLLTSDAGDLLINTSATPSTLQVQQGESAEVRIDIIAVFGDGSAASATVGGYAIDLPETAARIDIATRPCADGTGTPSCEIWTITPDFDAIPGRHAIGVLPQNPSESAAIGGLTFLFDVLADPTPGSVPPVSRVYSTYSNPDPDNIERALLETVSVVTADSERWSWGRNRSSQTGVSYERISVFDRMVSRQPGEVFIAARDTSGGSWEDVISGNMFSGLRLGRRSDGQVYTWGHGVADGFDPAPVPYQPFVNATDLAAQASLRFGIRDGNVLVREEGDNRGLTNFEYSFDGLSLIGADFVGIDASTTHLLIRSADGRVFLSSEKEEGRPVFPDTHVLTGAGKVIAAYGFSMAIMADGTVQAWGENAFGQLGIGNRTGTETPTSIPGLSDIVAIAPYGYTVHALDSMRRLWRWGWYGPGEDDVDTSPVLIDSLSNVLSIGGGFAVTGDCASGGFLWKLGRAPSEYPELVHFFGTSHANCPLRLFVNTLGEGSVSSMPAGIDCGLGGDQCSQDFASPIQVLLEGHPEPGWMLDPVSPWTGAADCADGMVNVDQALQCTAHFVVQESFRLNFGIIGSGSVREVSGPASCDTTCTLTLPAGTRIWEAVADSGFEFTEWARDCAGFSNPTPITLIADTFCRAVFTETATPQVRLGLSLDGSGTGSVTGGGLNCEPTCSIILNQGTHVLLNAAAASGSEFLAWGGTDICSDPDYASGPQLSITVDSDLDCTATFSEVASGDLAITVENGDTGHGRVSSTPAGIDACVFQGSTTIPAGCGIHTFSAVASITLEAEAIDGALFEGWDGCDRTTANPGGGNELCEVDGPGTRTVRVLFVF